MKKIFIVLAFGVAACAETGPEGYINPGLSIHVSNFVNEARARGVEVDTKNLFIDFRDLHGESAGRSVVGQHVISIDSNSMQWRVNPEWVVFHELGHSYLYRDHNDESTFTGFITLPTPNSVMHSQIVIPYGTGRTEYLDELFN